MSKRFAEMNQVRVGLVGLLVIVIVLGVLANIGTIGLILNGGKHTAAFREAGQLKSGMAVRVSGLSVGEVTDVSLDGDHVQVSFTAPGVQLGESTRAAIKTENALGRMFLDVQPAGAGELTEEIPLSRTQSQYSVNEALSDVTVTTGQIDTQRLAQSFDTLSHTFQGTPPQLGPAMRGVERLSTSIASRDQGLRELLGKANSVSGVLSERNAQITKLMTDGNSLLGMLQDRRQTLHELMSNVTAATNQLTAIAGENNRTLGPALTDLRGTLKVLNGQMDNLRQVMQLLGGFGRELGESLGGGPWFYGYFGNLPLVDIVPVLPSLFGVGKPPNYPTPPPEQQPPPGADLPRTGGDPYDPKGKPVEPDRPSDPKPPHPLFPLLPPPPGLVGAR